MNLIFLFSIVAFTGLVSAAPMELLTDELGQQLIVVSEVQGVIAKLETFERGPVNKWALIDSYPAVIGLSGFAAVNKKREGDKKTPTGLYNFGTSWGYAETIDSKMPYRMATDEDKYIDDIDSNEYNQWVHGFTDAKSFEKMKRADGLYEIGIVIDYNTNPVVKGFGSAIFLHIWKSDKQGTAGCVAVAKSSLLEIMRWLDPTKKPKILLNPPLLN